MGGEMGKIIEIKPDIDCRLRLLVRIVVSVGLGAQAEAFFDEAFCLGVAGLSSLSEEMEDMRSST
jgi:hypothetical protein